MAARDDALRALVLGDLGLISAPPHFMESFLSLSIL
jgi:hypothetical protein